MMQIPTLSVFTITHLAFKYNFCWGFEEIQNKGHMHCWAGIS